MSAWTDTLFALNRHVGDMSDGGGIRFKDTASHTTIWKCSIINCEVGDDGGGIYISDGSSPLIHGCLIADNESSSTDGGGGGKERGRSL